MKYTKLVEEVNRILTDEWDPIGVVAMGAGEHAYTEYVSYAKGIAKMLREGVPEYRLMKHLVMLRTKHIGLSADDEADLLITRQLLKLIES